MDIRELGIEDLPDILELYTQLHDNPLPLINEHVTSVWNKIIRAEDHHVIGGYLDETLVSSCVIVVIPNLTHNQRPYAVIENVITDAAYRGQGHASALLNYAKDIATEENCYKIMLMTSSKDDSTLSFYENAGYNRQDKTAFIQWL